MVGPKLAWAVLDEHIKKKKKKRNEMLKGSRGEGGVGGWVREQSAGGKA